MENPTSQSDTISDVELSSNAQLEAAPTTLSPAHSTAPVLRKDGSVLPIAGYSLLAYSLYSLIFLLYSNRSADPLITLDKINSFVGFFPPLLIAYALIFSNDARISAVVDPWWRKLLRQTVAVLAVVYLTCGPLALVQQLSQQRLVASNASRAVDFLTKRKDQILGSVENLQSGAEFVRTLRQFPEIAGINIKPNDSPAEIIKGMTIAIDKEIARQKQVFQAEIQNQNSAVALSSRRAMLGSLLAGLSFLALGTHLLPWLAGLAKYVATIRTSFVRFFSNLGAAWRKQQLRPNKNKLISPQKSPFAGLGKWSSSLQRNFSKWLKNVKKQAEIRRAGQAKSKSNRKRSKRSNSTRS
jgi:hypothetical protein